MCTITTDNKPRFTLHGLEVPEEVITYYFDYLTPDQVAERTFIKYLGEYYDLQEFTKVDQTGAFKGWDGFSSDSAWSGKIIKIIDSDRVLMGRYYYQYSTT